MEIEVRVLGNVVVVAIKGSLDALTAPKLSATFDAEFAAGRLWLVADLEQVDYTSSTGLRALPGAVKQARQRGGDLRLARPRPEVLKLLKMSGFTSILKVFSDIDTAVASY